MSRFDNAYQREVIKKKSGNGFNIQSQTYDFIYLHLDKEKTPLIIDQPEDNLDNDSIFSVLAKCIRQAKKSRQVILVTHNPNLAVGADAEQILFVSLDKVANYKFSYEAGSIENPRINDVIVKILEGSRPAFVQRRLKYQIG